MKRSVALAVTTILACLMAVPISAVADSPDCPAFEIIGARGTYEAAGTLGMGAITASFASKMRDLIDPNAAANSPSPVKLSGVEYPSEAGWMDETPEGSFYKGKVPKIYFDSVKLGARELVTMIEDSHQSCGSTQFILGGYSQGADVVRTALQYLADDEMNDELAQIAGVVGFGDPYFDPKEPAANYGTFSPSRTGLFGPTIDWEDLTDAPIVSVCIA